MNLHVLYNGGDGTYDVVNITDTGEVEYISTEFMDGQHATAYIAGWHDAKASAGPRVSESEESGYLVPPIWRKRVLDYDKDMEEKEARLFEMITRPPEGDEETVTIKMTKTSAEEAYDKGGYWPPGVIRDLNDTGKPKRVLTDEQWQQVNDALNRRAD